MPENIYGGSFPWSSFIGIGGSDGPSQEEKDYLDWSSFSGWGDLPESGIGGDDYLNSFQGDFPTGIAAYIEGTDPLIDTENMPTIEDLIASGVLTADASGVPGPAPIDDPLEIIDDEAAGETENIRDTTYDYSGYGLDDKPIGDTITDGTTTVSTFSGPSAGKELLEGLGIDTTEMTPQEIAQAVAGMISGGGDDLGGDTVDDDQSSILDLLGSPYGDVSVLSDEEVVNQTTNDLLNGLPEGGLVDDEEDENTLPIIIGQDQVGGGISGIDPDDIVNAGNTDEVFGIDTEADADVGEGGGIKDMLSRAYDKLGIQGMLGILSLLGLGKAVGASGEGDAMGGGGIGSFASSQFDPSGLGATADYANMPGGGVGQPTFLPNTNAPIYYPFASEVTKQYNAQSPEPFSFTRGPAPEAMIQNLDYQQVPGVQYVADGAFMRRNGLTEGPGTETSDDIPAMLSDGEFVTNAEANRGIGAMALLDQGMPMEEAMNPEQQRLAGARQMYLQQAMGQQLAKQMRNR